MASARTRRTTKRTRATAKPTVTEDQSKAIASGMVAPRRQVVIERKEVQSSIAPPSKTNDQAAKKPEEVDLAKSSEAELDNTAVEMEAGQPKQEVQEDHGVDAPALSWRSVFGLLILIIFIVLVVAATAILFDLWPFAWELSELL